MKRTSWCLVACTIGTLAFLKWNLGSTLPKAPIQPERDAVPLRFGTPIKVTSNGTFIDEPIQVSVLKPVPGNLVYTYTKSIDTGAISFAIHNFSAGTIGSALQSILTYPIQKSAQAIGSQIYSPLWSPNGRYILFKFGSPQAIINSYQIFVLDTQTNQLKVASNRQLANSSITWSPDSNYITIINNGDSNGNTTLAPVGDYVGPLQLLVCDWRTEKEHLVISNDTIMGPFKWIAPHTLLYSAVISKDQAVSSGKNNQSATPERPNVYEYSPETHQSKLLVRDGYQPTPSQDGQWIAFFGSEHPEKPDTLRDDWQYTPHGAALTIARHDGTDRIVLNRETNTYPKIRWLPDRKHLLALQQTKGSPNAEAIIREWDIQTRHFRQVSKLYAKDYKQIDFQSDFSHFDPLEVSNDKKSLFIFVIEFIGKIATNASFKEVISLKSIDLKTGVATTIATVQGSDGEDWHDNFMASVPATTSSIASASP